MTSPSTPRPNRLRCRCGRSLERPELDAPAHADGLLRSVLQRLDDGPPRALMWFSAPRSHAIVVHALADAGDPYLLPSSVPLRVGPGGWGIP